MQIQHTFAFVQIFIRVCNILYRTKVKIYPLKLLARIPQKLRSFGDYVWLLMVITKAMAWMQQFSILAKTQKE